MSSINLKDNIYWVGVKDPELRVFDIIMETKKGTTYNSYLIADEKVAVIDSVKTGFFNEFLSNIKEVIGDRKVDYIIVQHTELDHSGSISELLEHYPDAVLVGSKAALIYCKKILNRDFKSIDINNELCLGNTTLRFVTAPNLHWPDTMFTYTLEQKVLFTCDVMGCHFCPTNGITDDCGDDYFDEMKYYFDVIMGPFKKFVLAGLEKIKDFNMEIIAPSHGPVHVKDINKYLELYRQWSEPAFPRERKVEIFYVSAYGNTEEVARYLAEKLADHDIKADCHEITSMPFEKAVEYIENSVGILIGSPTINQDAVKPVWDLLSLVSPITNRGKAAGAFGSYGWSGEGVPMLTERLRSLKFKTVEAGLKVNFVASKEEFKKADEFVKNFVELMR